MLSQVLDTVLRDDDAYLRALWENSTFAERQVLAALAGGEQSDMGLTYGRLHSSTDADPRLDGPELVKTLQSLCRRSLVLRIPVSDIADSAAATPGTLVEQESTRFLFSFDLFRRWVLAQASYKELAGSRPTLS